MRSSRLSISALALVVALVVAACGGAPEFNDAVGVAAPPGTTLAMLNVLGMTSAEPTPGTVTFQVAGQTLTLAPTVDDDGSLFFVFGDQTNGDTTYGAGRFLNTPPAKMPSPSSARPCF